MKTTRETDESQLRRLAYIKALFRMGVSNLETKLDPYLAQAVLTFDNSIEMLLWLLVDYQQIPIGNRNINFPELLSKVTTKEQALKSRSRQLSELHSCERRFGC